MYRLCINVMTFCRNIICKNKFDIKMIYLIVMKVIYVVPTYPFSYKDLVRHSNKYETNILIFS